MIRQSKPITRKSPPDLESAEELRGLAEALRGILELMAWQGRLARSALQQIEEALAGRGDRRRDRGKSGRGA